MADSQGPPGSDHRRLPTPTAAAWNATAAKSESGRGKKMLEQKVSYLHLDTRKNFTNNLRTEILGLRGLRNILKPKQRNKWCQGNETKYN